MNLDLISTVGREFALVGEEAGAFDVTRQDGYEAFVRAGLQDQLTPSGIAALSRSQRERLRDALVKLWEVPIGQAEVDEALACISWHWPPEGGNEKAP